MYPLNDYLFICIYTTVANLYEINFVNIVPSIIILILMTYCAGIHYSKRSIRFYLNVKY